MRKSSDGIRPNTRPAMTPIASATINPVRCMLPFRPRHSRAAEARSSGGVWKWKGGATSARPAMLSSRHVRPPPRFLVRVRLDLLLSGGHAHRRTCARSRRERALAAIPAGADLQGAGLDHVAVQHLPGEGRVYVARPRADLRRTEPTFRAAGTVPAEHAPDGPRRADRFRAGLGRSLDLRGVSQRTRGRPGHW